MVTMNLDKIFEGETFKNVWPSLRALANNHVRRDFAGLKRQLGRDADESAEHFTAALKADENLRVSYAEVVRNHLVGYFGEIAVHAALGRDWHDVYKFNDLME